MESARARLGPLFRHHNYNVVDNPKVTVHIDDARHFLLTTNQKFDAIVGSARSGQGPATLYTVEFFEIGRST